MGPRRRCRSRPLGRLLRGRRLDRNPLRRRSDRAETVVLGLLLAAFLAAAPFAMHAAGTWAHVRAVREQHAQQARLDQVQAVVLQGAPSLDGPGDVSARWRAPAGPVRTGEVLVLPGTEAGTTVPVWINRVGQQEGPPLLGSEVTSRVQLAEGLAVAVLALAAFALGRLARWLLDRRRLAAWDADWLATAPRWSPRH
jgi:hypothetical protein